MSSSDTDDSSGSDNSGACNVSEDGVLCPCLGFCKEGEVCQCLHKKCYHKRRRHRKSTTALAAVPRPLTALRRSSSASIDSGLYNQYRALAQQAAGTLSASPAVARSSGRARNSRSKRARVQRGAGESLDTGEEMNPEAASIPAALQRQYMLILLEAPSSEIPVMGSVQMMILQEAGLVAYVVFGGFDSASFETAIKACFKLGVEDSVMLLKPVEGSTRYLEPVVLSENCVPSLDAIIRDRQETRKSQRLSNSRIYICGKGADLRVKIGTKIVDAKHRLDQRTIITFSPARPTSPCVQTNNVHNPHTTVSLQTGVGVFLTKCPADGHSVLWQRPDQHGRITAHKVGDVRTLARVQSMETSTASAYSSGTGCRTGLQHQNPLPAQAVTEPAPTCGAITPGNRNPTSQSSSIFDAVARGNLAQQTYARRMRGSSYVVNSISAPDVSRNYARIMRASQYSNPASSIETMAEEGSSAVPGDIENEPPASSSTGLELMSPPRRTHPRPYDPRVQRSPSLDSNGSVVVSSLRTLFSPPISPAANLANRTLDPETIDLTADESLQSSGSDSPIHIRQRFQYVDEGLTEPLRELLRMRPVGPALTEIPDYGADSNGLAFPADVFVRVPALPMSKGKDLSPPTTSLERFVHDFCEHVNLSQYRSPPPVHSPDLRLSTEQPLKNFLCYISRATDIELVRPVRLLYDGAMDIGGVTRDITRQLWEAVFDDEALLLDDENNLFLPWDISSDGSGLHLPSTRTSFATTELMKLTGNGLLYALSKRASFPRGLDPVFVRYTLGLTCDQNSVFKYSPVAEKMAAFLLAGYPNTTKNDGTVDVVKIPFLHDWLDSFPSEKENLLDRLKEMTPQDASKEIVRFALFDCRAHNGRWIVAGLNKLDLAERLDFFNLWPYMEALYYGRINTAEGVKAQIFEGHLTDDEWIMQLTVRERFVYFKFMEFLSAATPETLEATMIFITGAALHLVGDKIRIYFEDQPKPMPEGRLPFASTCYRTITFCTAYEIHEGDAIMADFMTAFHHNNYMGLA